VSLFPLLPFFLSIYAGKLINRIGSKRPILLSSLFGVISICIPFFWGSLIGLVVSQIIAGVCNTFFVIAAQSYVGRTSKTSERDDHVMRFSLGAAVGTFLGPTIGGFIADRLTTSHSFLILGVIVVVAIVLSIYLTKESNLNGVNKESEIRDTVNILSFFEIKNFRRAIFISTLILTGKDTFTSFFPLLGVEMGMSSATIGIIVSINALAGILIRWALPILLHNYSRSRVVVISVIFSGVCMLLLPFFNQIVIIGVISFLLGLGLGLGQPLSISITLYSLPEILISRGLGLRITANRFVQMSSPVMFGFIAQIINLSSIFWLTGVVYLFGSVKTTIMESEIKNK
jgi:MFS family permease